MEEVKERRDLSWQGMFYGMQRLDLLIVTIITPQRYSFSENSEAWRR